MTKEAPSSKLESRAALAGRLRPLAWRASFVLLASSFALSARADFTPREAYNQGVDALRKGYLREAENWFLEATAQQRESLQPPALYDLGHVRFLQGKELLKGESPRQPLIDHADTANEDGVDATMKAKRALKTDQLDQILEAYLNGRPVRKQLRLAHEDVQRALDLYGAVLVRWRRSVGDFRSSDELKRSEDATFNAHVVERHIEELLKQVKQLEQQKQQIGQTRQELKEKMKELKGKIPDEMKQPGQGDDDDEEEDEPGKEQPKPESGWKDQTQKEGEKRGITPEIAQQILEALGLKGDRKLPVGGDEQQNKPRDRKTKDW
jgi:TolA-binding protein